MNKLSGILVSIPLIILSSNAIACDDKSCERAYLQSTHQYVENYGRQANAARTEREAYAMNRERRDYAVANHLHRVNFHIAKK